jgi:hypothetical protein
LVVLKAFRIKRNRSLMVISLFYIGVLLVVSIQQFDIVLQDHKQVIVGDLIPLGQFYDLCYTHALGRSIGLFLISYLLCSAALYSP